MSTWERISNKTRSSDSESDSDSGSASKYPAPPLVPHNGLAFRTVDGLGEIDNRSFDRVVQVGIRCPLTIHLYTNFRFAGKVAVERLTTLIDRARSPTRTTSASTSRRLLVSAGILGCTLYRLPLDEFFQH